MHGVRPFVRPVSILIADDHPVMRRGVRMLLELNPGWTVCAEVDSGSEAVRQAALLKPQVAVLDISMPDLTGIEAAADIRRVSPQTGILILSMHHTEEFVQAAVKAGAKGYVLKRDAETDLVMAVSELIHGRSFFTSAPAEALLGVHPTPRLDNDDVEPESLTQREYRVLQLVAEGKTNKEVASELGISTRTAENHRAAVMRKLNVHSTGQLVRYAVRQKIVTP